MRPLVSSRPAAALVLLAGLLAPTLARASLVLQGTVRSESGAPLPGAQVIVYTAAPRAGAPTLCPGCYPDCAKRREADRLGRFEIPGLADSLLFRVLVLARGFAPRFLERVDPAAGPLEIRLAPRLAVTRTSGAIVRGAVADPYGLPVAGAEVIPIGWARRSGGRAVARRFLDQPGPPLAITDDLGQFTIIMKDSSEAWTLRVSARDLATATFDDVPGGEPVVLRLRAGTTLDGRLTRDGRPLPGATVGAVEAGIRGRGFAGREEIAADGNGRFAIVNAPARESLLVYARMESLPPGVALPAATIVSGPDDSTTTLAPLAAVAAIRLAGRVEAGGAALPAGARLAISRRAVPDTAFVALGDDGRFAYPNAPPGEGLDLGVVVRGHHLSPRTAGFDPGSGAVRLAPGADLGDVQLLLDPGDPPAAAGPRGRR